jgi:hypothetical protein
VRLNLIVHDQEKVWWNVLLATNKLGACGQTLLGRCDVRSFKVLRVEGQMNPRGKCGELIGGSKLGFESYKGLSTVGCFSFRV